MTMNETSHIWWIASTLSPPIRYTVIDATVAATADAMAAASAAAAAATTASICSQSYMLSNDDVDDASMDDADLNNSNLASVYFQTLVYCMYILIFVVAMLGNGIVCYVVQSTPRMRTVTNIFIANLAVGDILMTLFCVPFSFVSILLLAYWPFGSAMCHMVNYSQAVSVLVSAYTLVAISVDRYMAIMWPLRPRITKRCAKFVIFAIWVVALLTALPIPIVSHLQQPPGGWHEHCDKYICAELWPSAEANIFYTLCLLTLQFVVPLAVLVFTYTRIAMAVWGKRPPGEAENSRDRRMEKSKRKMVKMMVTVVVVFTICWLPFNVLTFQVNNEAVANWWMLPYVWFASHWLAMSHSCYNPVIYCYMNARFRSGFRNIWHRLVYGRWWCACLRRRQHDAMLRPAGDGRSSHRQHSRRTGESHFVMGGTENMSPQQLQRVNTTTTFISGRNNRTVSTCSQKICDGPLAPEPSSSID